MPQISFNGQEHEFPEGTSPQEIEKVLLAMGSMPKEQPAVTGKTAFTGGEPPKVPLSEQNNLPLVPGLGPTVSWSGMRETPDQLRQAMADRAKILQHEAATNPAEANTLMQLVSHAIMTSTAANPYQVAKAKKPESVYKKLVYGN